jgi:alpha/beta superfamily hydrolase
MNFYGLKVLVLVFFGLDGGVCLAGDAKREADFASEIGKSVLLGKQVWLESSGHKFLGLYTETDKKLSKGTVIILHDQGGHPNQLALIKNLRSQLPDHNWSTLSLQMPIREMGAGEEEYYSLFPEALSRIEAGIKYVKESKVDNIVLVGYGLGALMAIYAQSEKPMAINSLVAISLAVPDTEDKVGQTLAFIKKIKRPILEIYAENDQLAVTETARDRRLAAKENSDYRQLKINDENHLYRHDEDTVVKRIYSWIERSNGNQPIPTVTAPQPATVTNNAPSPP